MSSLRRGHANLLCIIPILVYVLPKRALVVSFSVTTILFIDFTMLCFIIFKKFVIYIFLYLITPNILEINFKFQSIYLLFILDKF